MINENQVSIEGESQHNFVFDNGFKHGEEFYTKQVKALLKHFFDGVNVCILPYGQTGSGKTYTMGTCSAKINSDEWKDSVIQKLIKDINEEIHHETERDFMMRVSFIEVIRAVQQ